MLVWWAKYYFNEYTTLDVSLNLLELRYKKLNKKEISLHLYIAIRETMDTLMALKYIKKFQHSSMIITNSLQHYG